MKIFYLGCLCRKLDEVRINDVDIRLMKIRTAGCVVENVNAAPAHAPTAAWSAMRRLL